MGRAIERIAKERGHQIVCVIDADNPQDFDSPGFKSADVAIEFTAPEAAFGNCLKAFERHIKVVSGTTGWTDKHRAEIEKLTHGGENTLFWASNYSIGVAVFAALNRYLAGIMNRYPQYNVAMEETHHVHKKDAPSGTAITLAEDIVAHLDRKQGWSKGRFTAPDGTISGSARATEDQIAVNSVRKGEVPGIHTITYTSPADTITITHEAHNRDGFALGAVLAAEYTRGHQGLLSMSDLFKF